MIAALMTHVSFLPIRPHRASKLPRREVAIPPRPRVAEGTSSMPDDGDGTLASAGLVGLITSGSMKVTVRLIGRVPTEWVPKVGKVEVETMLSEPAE